MLLDFNPDATDPEELERCAEQFGLLAMYCTHAAGGKRHRLAGHIDQALSEERYCDLLYAKLDPDLRW